MELTNASAKPSPWSRRGLSNDQIAGRMVSSPLTAKTQVDRAMTKLHARDRAELVVLVYESGLVIPRDP